MRFNLPPTSLNRRGEPDTKRRTQEEIGKQITRRGLLKVGAGLAAGIYGMSRAGGVLAQESNSPKSSAVAGSDWRAAESPKHRGADDGPQSGTICTGRRDGRRRI
jgi:hypothetical protein